MFGRLFRRMSPEEKEHCQTLQQAHELLLFEHRTGDYDGINQAITKSLKDKKVKYLVMLEDQGVGIYHKKPPKGIPFIRIDGKSVTAFNFDGVAYDPFATEE